MKSGIDFKTFLMSFISTSVGSLPFVFLLSFFILPKFYEITFEGKQHSTSVAVESVFKILHYYNEKVNTGQLDLTSAQNEAKNLIATLRYNGSEYFWIHSKNLVMIMHPTNPKLDGQDLSNYKDPNGVKLFKEMVDVVATSSDKQGYVNYMWPKPGSDQPVQKSSFVKEFEPWGWIIGNGVYMDSVESSYHKIRNESLFYYLISFIWLVASGIFTAFHTFKTKVKPVQIAINSLLNEANSLSGSQKEMKQSSEKLQQSSRRQQESIAQISTATNEINQMMKRSEDIINDSVKLANNTRQSSEHGISSMREVEGDLIEIEVTSKQVTSIIDETNEDIEKFAEVMRLIVEKTKMINDIVFQTKLLSFNASVEAARAGDYGKGFSVVAEEIASLASRSGQSAKEIEEILSKSNILIHTVVKKLKENSTHAKSRTNEATAKIQKSSSNCLNILENVLDKATMTQKLNSEMLLAFNEQMKGVDEILRGINSIDSETEENMSNANKTTEISNVISINSSNLNDIVQTLQDSRQMKKVA